MGTNTSGLYVANYARTEAGAARQVARANRALLAMNNMTSAERYLVPPVVLARYMEALQMRVRWPDHNLTELGARAGMSKSRYWGILRRAMKFAETLGGKA